MKTTAIILTASMLGLTPAHQQSSVEGVWRTDGYGTIVAIKSGHLTTYEVTKISCLPGQITADRQGPPGHDGAQRFASGGVEVLTVTPQRHTHARLQLISSVGSVGLIRIPKVPARCAPRPPDKNPLTSFDVFWQTFRENYPFFGVPGGRPPGLAQSRFTRWTGPPSARSTARW